MFHHYIIMFSPFLSLWNCVNHLPPSHNPHRRAIRSNGACVFVQRDGLKRHCSLYKITANRFFLHLRNRGLYLAESSLQTDLTGLVIKGFSGPSRQGKGGGGLLPLTFLWHLLLRSNRQETQVKAVSISSEVIYLQYDFPNGTFGCVFS